MNSPGGLIQVLLNNPFFSSELSLEKLFAQESIQPHLKSHLSDEAREGRPPRWITGRPLCRHGRLLPRRCGAKRFHGACVTHALNDHQLGARNRHKLASLFSSISHRVPHPTQSFVPQFLQSAAATGMKVLHLPGGPYGP